MCCVVDTISRFQSLGEGEGNVHSGATPPWLREDNNEGGAPTQIGPSEEEFLRHSKWLSSVCLHVHYKYCNTWILHKQCIGQQPTYLWKE